MKGAKAAEPWVDRVGQPLPRQRILSPREVKKQAIGVPHTWKNKHIHSGYRLHPSELHALETLIRPNSETANVWTALVGSLAAFHILRSVWPVMEALDECGEADSQVTSFALWFAFVAYATHCLLVGAYHTFVSVPDLFDIASTLDLVAIQLYAVAEVPAMLIGLRAAWGPGLDLSGWEGILYGACLVGAVVMGYLRGIRRYAAPLWLLAASIVMPLLVGIGVLGLEEGYWVAPSRSPDLFDNIPLSHLCWLGLVASGVGAVLHIGRMPERFIPHALDLFGNGHNLWHLSNHVTFLTVWQAAMVVLARDLEARQACAPAKEAALAAAFWCE